MNTIVVRTCGTEHDSVILELACHHYVTVPLADEEALSFVGAEVECTRHFPLTYYLTEEEADGLRARTATLDVCTWEPQQVTHLIWIAMARLRGYGAYSEHTTREERCRNLSL